MCESWIIGIIRVEASSYYTIRNETDMACLPFLCTCDIGDAEQSSLVNSGVALGDQIGAGPCRGCSRVIDAEKAMKDYSNCPAEKDDSTNCCG